MPGMPGLPTVSPGAGDETTPLLAAPDCSQIPVYPLVHEIRVDIVAHIDTPLTYEQLVAPDSTYTIIRPLTEKYLAKGNQAVVFCLLLNKVQFVADSHKISIATLSTSRATLCEILAIRVLRGWSERSLALATLLLTPWPLFQGAPPEVVAAARDDGEEDALVHSGTALEMAIISSSKHFIRSPSCQKVIEGIWSGKIIYTSQNTHALIQDNYKKRPIQIYNPHKAPLLDHYRLKVPKIRAFLEYMNFVILFVLYIVAMEHLDINYINGYEVVFIIYALAFSLDKAATIREHGLKVFSSSLVNGFDLGFVIIFAVYLGSRCYGFWRGNEAALIFGTDLLAIGAVPMFPRLAFVTLANNLMILSIRSMLTEFFFLMSVGIFCFLGFIYGLRTLGLGREPRHPVSEICWWLLEIYFGLDATGFIQSSDFHPFIGPILIVVYAFLSNTLLLTVSVAILGNTFATINADAAAESMFRRAVATLEGVKSDSVFSYQLPFNIVALVILFPLSFVLNPRWFHKVNVLMIRVTNLPVLLLIAIYERQTYNQTTIWERICEFTDHYMNRISAAAGFEGFVGQRMDISAVFDIEREFGTYYQGWDTPENEVFDDDQACAVAEDDEETPRGPLIDLEVTDSPIEDMHEPVTPRRRRVSMSSVPSDPSSPIVSTAAPLPRLRHQSLYGPSPLAQLFVGSVANEPHIPHRRTTFAVGSLPVTSSFRPASPRTARGVRHSIPAPGKGPGDASSSSSTASNLSSSVSMTSDTRPSRASMLRPSIEPILEVSQPPSPKSGSPDEPSSPVKPSRSVPFPPIKEEAPPVRVTFDPSLSSRTSKLSMDSTSSKGSKESKDKDKEKEKEKEADKDKSPVTVRDFAAPARPQSKAVTLFDKSKDVSPTLGKPPRGPNESPGMPTQTLPSPLLRPQSTTNLSRLAPSQQAAAPSPLKRAQSSSNLGRLGRPQTPTSTRRPSASPALKGVERSPNKAPKTASELLESKESADRDAKTLDEHLLQMEERQERIEAMLQQLLGLGQQMRSDDDQGRDRDRDRRGMACAPRRPDDEHDAFDNVD